MNNDKIISLNSVWIICPRNGEIGKKNEPAHEIPAEIKKRNNNLEVGGRRFEKAIYGASQANANPTKNNTDGGAMIAPPLNFPNAGRLVIGRRRIAKAHAIEKPA